MRVRFAFLLAAVAVVISGIAFGESSDPFAEEPAATFLAKLGAFSRQPTERQLRDLSVLCERLPVRDMRPGQIGHGHPLDRDVKLTCMLRLLCTLDQAIAKPPTFEVVVQMHPSLDNPPPEDPVKITWMNLHSSMMNIRDSLAQFGLPDFLEYECSHVQKEHLRDTILRELKPDADAYDVQLRLLARIGAS